MDTLRSRNNWIRVIVVGCCWFSWAMLTGREGKRAGNSRRVSHTPTQGNQHVGLVACCIVHDSHMSSPPKPTVARGSHEARYKNTKKCPKGKKTGCMHPRTQQGVRSASQEGASRTRRISYLEGQYPVGNRRRLFGSLVLDAIVLQDLLELR